MSASDLDTIFNPKSIAVIGASDREGSVGYTLMKNLTELGYEGKVFPINIRKPNILGFKAYQSIDQVKEKVDLAIIATPAKTVPTVVEQCGLSGVKGLIIISAGFKEIGDEGKRLEREILEKKEKYGLHIIGPNCLGIIVPGISLNATFTHYLPEPGSIAFISQSGALGSAILDLASKLDIGFSHFVSIGSMLDVDFGDLIDYFGTLPQTESILIYIEGITDAKKFISASRNFARTKPIIVAKSGRYAESAKAASSHTGALAGEDMIYDAAFKRAGLIRVNEIADLFNLAEVLGKQPLPKGPNIAIITNAGGPGVMATDSIIANKGRLAVLSQKTLDNLNNSLPPFWSKGNPIDILGDSKADRYELTIETCLDDENIDGIIIIYTGQAIGVSEEIAKSLVKLLKKKGRKKPILTSFMGYKTVEEANQILTENGIPIYSTPEQAVRTYMYLYQYKYNLDMLYETPEELPTNISSPKLPLTAMLKDVAFEDREVLTEEEAKTFMVHCNLPVVLTQRARNADEAAILASKIGYPIVLKILSPQIIHKTDAGGVILNITDESELREAFDIIIKRAKQYDPKADILGVTVQPMIKTDGYEVIIGAKHDHIFGPVILFGMGGIGVEVFKDVVMGLPPLNQALARKMIESTKVYELLKGYRNKPQANLNLLEEIIVRFSQMIIDFPQIKEVDINPLIIDENEAKVLDARIIIDKKRTLKRIRTHENLVIIPYPSKYEDYTKLRNGKEILLRAIKPEDESLLLEMFNNIVEETKDYQLVVWYSLTFQPIRDRSHAVVARYCNIDYDKEITIIAETYEEEKRMIIGLIRLLIDGRTGEVAFIVSNQWNSLGLEEKLIENIIQISREKYLDKIDTKIFSENNKIIEFLKKSNFTFDNLNNRIVKASLTL